MIQSTKIIGTGIASTGIIGAGIGTGLVFAALALILGVVGLIIFACFGYNDLLASIYLMPMPGVKCPTCAERGIEQWVLPGKHCPRCSTACRVRDSGDNITAWLVYFYLVSNSTISLLVLYVLINGYSF